MHIVNRRLGARVVRFCAPATARPCFVSTSSFTIDVPKPRILFLPFLWWQSWICAALDRCTLFNRSLQIEGGSQSQNDCLPSLARQELHLALGGLASSVEVLFYLLPRQAAEAQAELQQDFHLEQLSSEELELLLTSVVLLKFFCGCSFWREGAQLLQGDRFRGEGRRGEQRFAQLAWTHEGFLKQDDVPAYALCCVSEEFGLF
eukprot:scaffold470_cov257-Pinguiococcus_pyrenoidosus.AAC.27